ncbi:DUF1269 domain-containing protein [Polaromonas sp. DSR2-3-2]|uniref:DUF1269 domain-containing protein n=1 Tax=unclassified Polaromonas TaxID=2638319 RepID=UPI003CFB132A
MNKLLVAIFDTETAAVAGLNALRNLHAAGDITLYATAVLARNAKRLVSVKESMDSGPIGTATGLAVGSLIGLLGGPAGVAIGALTGTVAGAVRDFWAAGVGLDFIEEATQHLQPGKVALVAEIEEEWVIPVDSALEAVGGQVLRRTRTEVAEAQFDHDIAALKSEIKELESEASHASGAAKTKLQAKLAAAKASLDSAVHHAQQRVNTLKEEADAKAEALKLQLSQAKGDVKARIEDRMKRVKSSYHARGAKLSQAWSLTKEALAVRTEGV